MDKNNCYCLGPATYNVKFKIKLNNNFGSVKQVHLYKMLKMEKTTTKQNKKQQQNKQNNNKHMLRTGKKKCGR